tara:strand:- start:747 stop:1394 length:648 start_codon:yes stop_codon:yes gene_type:complete
MARLPLARFPANPTANEGARMESEAIAIEPARTALVVIDMQNFTVAMDTAPSPARQVLDHCASLARACREAGVLVVLVRVGHADNAMPQPDVPSETSFAGGFVLTDEMREIAPELGPEDGDVIVDKYNWGAFHGTNLDAHLRRRGIDTLLMTGLVTHIGVDTTMREAYAHGYAQILVTDAAAAMTVAQHDFVLEDIAPRLSRLRTTKQVLGYLKA